MGRVDRYPGGTFCWLDLGTTDVGGAEVGSAAGWGVPPMDIPIGRFTVVSDPTGAAFTLTAFAGAFRGVDGS